jgi:TPR repeat protein
MPRLKLARSTNTAFGVAKDLPLAMRWYEAASNGGNSVAAKRVSDLWFRGPGIEHDQSKGLDFATRAYCLGDSEAAFSAHIHYVRGLSGPAPLPQDPELWLLRYIAELGKGQTFCELPDVRDQMASQLTRMSPRSLLSSDDVESLSGMIGLLPNPQTGDTRKVIGARAIQRHGEGDALRARPAIWCS